MVGGTENENLMPEAQKSIDSDHVQPNSPFVLVLLALK